MALTMHPTDIPVPVSERSRPVRTAAKANGLNLSAAFQGGDCCDGCQVLLGSSSYKDGADGSVVDDAAIVAEVDKELEFMTAWERIGSMYAWNQTGSRELEAQRWVEAGQSYIRALAYAQALSYQGSLVASCASWAPAEPQQQEVQRLCGEVYLGIALLQLRREAAEVDAHAEEKVVMLRKAAEASDRALQLNPVSVPAHIRLGLAKLRLAHVPSVGSDRGDLLVAGCSCIASARQLHEQSGQSADDELEYAFAEAAALTQDARKMDAPNNKTVTRGGNRQACTVS